MTENVTLIPYINCILLMKANVCLFPSIPSKPGSRSCLILSGLPKWASFHEGRMVSLGLGQCLSD